MSSLFICNYVHTFWWVQGLSYAAPDASAIEESNALALAIVPSEPGNVIFILIFVGCCFQFVLFLQFWLLVMFTSWGLVFAGASTFDSNAGQLKDFDPTGWELALVTTPSTDISSATERQLVGSVCGLSCD